MFKYLIIIMLCLGGCTAAAQETPLPQDNPKVENDPPIIQSPQGRGYGQIFQMMKPMMCNDTAVVENYIHNRFGEKELAYGLNFNQMGMQSMLTVFYLNPTSRTFSIVEHSAGGLSCILGQGVTFDVLDEDLMLGKGF